MLALCGGPVLPQCCFHLVLDLPSGLIFKLGLLLVLTLLILLLGWIQHSWVSHLQLHLYHLP